MSSSIVGEGEEKEKRGRGATRRVSNSWRPAHELSRSRAETQIAVQTSLLPRARPSSPQPAADLNEWLIKRWLVILLLPQSWSIRRGKNCIIIAAKKRGGPGARGAPSGRRRS